MDYKIVLIILLIFGIGVMLWNLNLNKPNQILENSTNITNNDYSYNFSNYSLEKKLMDNFSEVTIYSEVHNNVIPDLVEICLSIYFPNNITSNEYKDELQKIKNLLIENNVSESTIRIEKNSDFYNYRTSFYGILSANQLNDLTNSIIKETKADELTVTKVLLSNNIQALEKKKLFDQALNKSKTQIELIGGLEKIPYKVEEIPDYYYYHYENQWEKSLYISILNWNGIQKQIFDPQYQKIQLKYKLKTTYRSN